MVVDGKVKQRLVLDVRYVNFYLFKYKYKYEYVEVLKNVFEVGDFIFLFDLKSVYYYIMMYELDKEYLGFKWNNKYYVFKVLLFGISIVGYIFLKLMREIVKFWRIKGYKIVLYLDDGIGGVLIF